MRLHADDGNINPVMHPLIAPGVRGERHRETSEIMGQLEQLTQEKEELEAKVCIVVPTTSAFPCRITLGPLGKPRPIRAILLCAGMWPRDGPKEICAYGGPMQMSRRSKQFYLLVHAAHELRRALEGMGKCSCPSPSYAVITPPLYVVLSVVCSPLLTLPK